MVKIITRFSNTLRRNWLDIFTTSILAAICVAIIWVNFPQGQWLTGWDNIHPEFNLWLNIKRTFSAVWQENQGLGHIGGHGHAATLIHSLTIGLLSLVVPNIALRATFTSIMLLAGTFGALAVARTLFKRSPVKTLASFAVAAFYLLNLATLQNFYVPLESFVIFYGILPWVVTTFWRYLDQPSRRNHLFFILTSILLTPIGFIPPLFLAYGLVLTALSLPYLLTHRSWQSAKNIVILGATTLAINAFWLLPGMYFTLTHADAYLNSTNNQLSTQDFNLQSFAYGDLQSVSILEGFVFDSLDTPISNDQQLTYILQPWIDHLATPGIRPIGYALFAVIFIGLGVSVFKADSKRVGVVVVLIIGLTALAQNTPVFSSLAEIAKHIPVINQAFRASFTKFSVPTVFAYAILFGIGIEYMLELTPRFKPLLHTTILSLVTALLVIFMLPAFTGQMYYSALKQEIPDAYFELFAYMQQHPKQGRIANLPLQWNWGWTITDWGYTGSGFLWYGLEQPILDRAFDAWSEQNETYYLQLSTAIYNQDEIAFENLISKYNISWLLIDESVILPGSESEVLYIDEIKAILAKSPQINLEEEFDHLSLYKVTTANPNYLQTPQKVTSVDAETTYGRVDPVYQEYQNYISDTNTTNILYPFSSLSSTRSLSNLTQKDENLILSTSVTPGEYQLTFPDISQNEMIPFYVSATFQSSELILDFTPQFPELRTGSTTISAVSPKSVTLNLNNETLTQEDNLTLSISDRIYSVAPTSINQELGVVLLEPNQPLNIALFGTEVSSAEDLTLNFQVSPLETCWISDNYLGNASKTQTEFGIRLEATQSKACLSSRLGTLVELNEPLLATIRLDYRSPNGQKADFCLSRESSSTWSCDVSNIYNQINASSEWISISQTVVLSEKDVYWLNLFGRDSNSSKEPGITEYRNIDFITNEPIIFTQISDSFWTSEELSSIITVPPDGLVSVSSPISLAYTWNPNIQTPVRNCTVFDQGKVDSSVTEDSLVLSSENGGVACSYTSFNFAPLDLPYILNVEGEHLEGRGAKLYLNNDQLRKSDLEILLPQQDFSEMYTVLPKPNSNTYGYTVNFESKSFAGTTTSNTFENISLMYMPHDWLAKSKLEKLSNQSLQPDTISNSVVITTDPQPFGSAIHTVSVSSTLDSGIFTLLKSYDSAWIAFSYRRSNNPITSMTSFKLLDHHIYNGWANAWSLPPCDSEVTRCEYVVIALYWPQFLAWIGFGLFITTIIVFLTNHHHSTLDRKRKKNSSNMLKALIQEKLR